jgi:uncharacterized protein
MNFRLKFLRAVASAVHTLAWPIVIISLLLAGFSVYYAFGMKRLKFSGNPNDLLRSDSVYHQKYLEYTKEFRAEEDYVVVVAGPEFEQNRQCVEFLAARFKEKPDLFKKVFYHIDIRETADQRGMLFLKPPQLLEIEGKIKEFTSLMGKNTFNVDLNSLLEVASQKFDPKYMRKKENEAGVDAFAEQFVTSLNALADRLEGKNTSKLPQFGNFLAENSDLKNMEQQLAENEYIAFNNGTILLINIPSPNAEASFGDHDYIIKPIKEIIADAKKTFPDLEIGLTGEPALSEDQAKATQHDSTVSSIVTFVLIALLFLVSFREFSRPGLALVALVVAICWTVGFIVLAIGRLNILTMAFIPMILGLGIDFGIQILGRYEEELPKVGDVITAITHTLLHTGNAIIIGASTTAAAFYTMWFNEFSGLAEMGIIGGTGILLCVIANLVLFPALLAIRDQRAKSLIVPKTQHYDQKINFFDRLILDKPWSIIGVAALITAFAIFQIPKIRFDYNLLKLQNDDLESVKFERKLLGKEKPKSKGESDAPRSVLCAVSIANTLQEAEEKAEKFKKLDVVREVISVTEMVPKDQPEKLKIISRIKSKLETVKLPQSEVKVNVSENIKALQKLRKNAAQMKDLARQFASDKQADEAKAFFDKLIQPMDRALAILGSMNQAQAEQILTTYQTHLFKDVRKNLAWLKNQKVDRPISVDDIPSNVRERYIGKNGKILIEIYPVADIWEREPLARFVDKLTVVDKEVTGTPVQNFYYIDLLRESYVNAAYYALAAIVIIIFIHFRTLKYIVPTLLPLFLGMIWAAGAMPLLNLPFNPANIITLPLVIGIGVAYGVYAVDRYRENSSPALFSTSTGKAILLSALTTIFGFGSLAFASDPSLASLGLLMSIGVVMCLITSLYVCPAVLNVLGRRQLK